MTRWVGIELSENFEDGGTINFKPFTEEGRDFTVDFRTLIRTRDSAVNKRL